MNNITTTDAYASRDDYYRFSVSRIKCYKECPQLYKLRYVDRVDVYKPSNATVVGNLLHAALEYLYGTEDEEVETCIDAFYKILSPELSKLGISAEPILGDLLDYHQAINQLYVRASAGYMGPDAIRTKSGGVPKAPEMTGVWKSEVKKLDLAGKKARIDYVIQQSKKGLEDISITEVFTKAYNLATKYVTPDPITEILHLELPITEWDKETSTIRNPIKFPGCKHEDVFLNGYVDNIARVMYKGKEVLAVIDYKTSKEEFNDSIVEHNQQLLLYAKGVSELLGEEVTHVAILSLLTNNLVIVPVDEELQEEVIENFNLVIDKIFAKDWHKHVPDTKYSPCLNSFGGKCPMLEHCWPKSMEYFNRQNMVDDFINPYG